MPDGGRGENSTRACSNPYCRGGWVERGDNESGGAPAFPCRAEDCPHRSRAAVPDVTALAEWVESHNEEYAEIAEQVAALLALVERQQTELAEVWYSLTELRKLVLENWRERDTAQEREHELRESAGNALTWIENYPLNRSNALGEWVGIANALRAALAAADTPTKEEK